MYTVHELSRPIRVIEHVWIPMRDGCRLSARIWLPVDAETDPVPAILEYIPYRKSDGTAVRDATIHPYFAGHGYASVRVDMRGAGDSEGVMLDEYLPIEQDDGEQVITWLATQPWCTGTVGMIGISWGGVAALQAAVRNPPALKAIIPVCSSVDRYYDDGGYFMGCMAGQTIGWGAVMFGFNSRAPDPLVVGERWREMWLERLKAPLFLRTWLEHQRCDALWKQGSVCEDYAKIKCPVYAVTGWSDCWPNTVLRLLQDLPSQVPRRGLIGPWGHIYPHIAFPGPDMGFLQEAVRWWDRWLKGIENGVDSEPQFVGYVMEEVPATASHSERPGRWVAESQWPSAAVARQRLYFANGRLDAQSTNTSFKIRSPQSCGMCSGEYMPWYTSQKTAQLPLDQREDDAKSVSFDTEPLDQPLELLGTPTLRLCLESDKRLALVAARLCDVAADGASTLISLGILNLAQRNGREMPQPLTPGERYLVTVHLNDTGYKVVPGHRLRLALSTSYWPMAWPTPENATVTVHNGQSHLDLPARHTVDGVSEVPAFGIAEGAAPMTTTSLRPGRDARTISRDVETGIVSLDILKDAGRTQFSHNDIEAESITTERFSIHDSDPTSACAEYTCDYNIGRGHWQTRTRGHLRMTSTLDDFIVTAQLEAFENDHRVFERKWDFRVPRDAF